MGALVIGTAAADLVIVDDSITVVPTPSTNASASQVTDTVYTCSSSTAVGTEGTITISDFVTSTYCPVCEESSRLASSIYYTTYITEMVQSCPTGTTISTFTITESCTGSSAMPTTGVPEGFTTKAYVCTACEGSPTITITEPCDCTKTEMPATAPATAVASGTPAAAASSTSASTNSPLPYTSSYAPAGAPYMKPGTAPLLAPAGTATRYVAPLSPSAAPSIIPYTGAATSTYGGFGACFVAVAMTCAAFIAVIL